MSANQTVPAPSGTAPAGTAGPVDDDAVIWQTAQQSRRWLDEQNGHDQQELTMRILKILEEAGEVAKAWTGATGQNPRKGVTGTLQDVADELGDVAFTSLVAAASLGFDPRQVLVAVASKVRDRLAVLPAAAEATL